MNKVRRGLASVVAIEGMINMVVGASRGDTLMSLLGAISLTAGFLIFTDEE